MSDCPCRHFGVACPCEVVDEIPFYDRNNTDNDEDGDD